MGKSRTEDSPPHLSNDPNPFCPVCEEMKSEGDRPEGKEVGMGHSCLLSIINAHYALSKREIEKG